MDDLLLFLNHLKQVFVCPHSRHLAEQSFVLPSSLECFVGLRSEGAQVCRERVVRRGRLQVKVLDPSSMSLCRVQSHHLVQFVYCKALEMLAGSPLRAENERFGWAGTLDAVG